MGKKYDCLVLTSTNLIIQPYFCFVVLRCTHDASPNASLDERYHVLLAHGACSPKCIYILRMHFLYCATSTCHTLSLLLACMYPMQDGRRSFSYVAMENPQQQPEWAHPDAGIATLLPLEAKQNGVLWFACLQKGGTFSPITIPYFIVYAGSFAALTVCLMLFLRHLEHEINA